MKNHYPSKSVLFGSTFKGENSLYLFHRQNKCAAERSTNTTANDRLCDSVTKTDAEILGVKRLCVKFKVETPKIILGIR